MLLGGKEQLLLLCFHFVECVHVRSVYVQVCVHVWRPEADISCLPLLLSTLLVSDGLSLNPPLTG